jgi:hypothetical protein
MEEFQMVNLIKFFEKKKYLQIVTFNVCYCLTWATYKVPEIFLISELD